MRRRGESVPALPAGEGRGEGSRTVTVSLKRETPASVFPAPRPSPTGRGGKRLRGSGGAVFPARGDLEGWASEKVALAVLDVEVDERPVLFFPLDSLGDHGRVDAAPDRGEARDDLALDRVGFQLA